MIKQSIRRKFFRLTVLLLTFIMLAVQSLPLFTLADTVDFDSEMRSKIATTYSILRAKRGYSYKGYCGVFIRDQLNASNVGFVINGGYNGNEWFSGLVEDAETVYGYTQKKYPGNNCLYDMMEILGGTILNVVISFTHQYGYSDAYPGAGHAVFIYAIHNGNVYFCESYNGFGISEGQPIVLSVDEFCYRYNKMYGDALGAVHFEREDSNGVGSENSGTSIYDIYYEIKNVGSEKYLNVYGSKDSENTYVTIYSQDQTIGQQFRIEPKGDAFRIFPLCAPERALNISSSKAFLNKPTESSQSDLWYLDHLEGNQFIIRHRLDPDMVLTTLSSSNSARAVIAPYTEGDERQIWEFSLNSIAQASKIYSVIWDIEGDIHRELYGYKELPVCPVSCQKEGVEFLGWDTEIVPITKNSVYVAKYAALDYEYTITFLFGENEYKTVCRYGETPSFAELPEIELGKPDFISYDRVPVPATEDAKYTVYYVYENKEGIRYHNGLDYLRGWNRVLGGPRYFKKLDGYLLTDVATIGGVEYRMNSDGTLYNGFYDIGGETRYYVNGIYQRGWREIEGKLYYFFTATGFMVKSESYTIGGLYREFNEDHSVKPINGWQNKSGYKYYYVDDEMITGWKDIDGERYYFFKSDDVFGQMASGWQLIGGKFYYFYAYGSDNYGKMVTENRLIGGSWHEFNSDGSVKTGFCKDNENTYYMLDDEFATGWQLIEGNYYYFYKESGIMVNESRYIGGVWHEFDSNGVCLTKNA